MFDSEGKRLVRIVYCPPISLLWSAQPDDGTPSDRIHKHYLRRIWRGRSPMGRLWVAVTFAAWPVVVFGTAIISTILHGAEAYRMSGRGRFRQIIDEIGLAARSGVLPPWYFIHELHDPRRSKVAAEYIQRYELKGGLYRVLRNFARSIVTQPIPAVSNKFLFFRMCRDAEIPTPAIYVEATRGRLRWRTDSGRLPHEDLFVKPYNENGGTGAELWQFAGDGRWNDGKGLTLAETEFLDRLIRLSKHKPTLAQARLTNHDSLSPLACGALATVRVLSIWDENDRPEATNAVFRMPARQGSIVDNFHAGGIAAAVDMETGTLGPATNFCLTEKARWYDTHPVTGARITGFRLPFWPEVLEVCRRTHELFQPHPTIGFDVAILQDGVSVVEGNSSSDLDLIQRPYRSPLGNARFGELLAFHLDRVEAWEQEMNAAASAAPT